MRTSSKVDLQWDDSWVFISLYKSAPWHTPIFPQEWASEKSKNSTVVWPDSPTFKVLGQKFLTRVAQIFGDFWAFKKQKYLSKKCSEYAFGQLSEIFGDLWAFKKQKYLSKKCSESAFGPLSETLGRSFLFQYVVALK